MNTCGWDHFQHGADIGVRGTGSNLGEAFEQAAMALTAVITNLESVQTGQCVEIRAQAPDKELLLVDWLNALVFEMATRGMLFSRFQVNIEQGRLHATAWGESVDRARHRPAVEVKGATYTELAVCRSNDGWLAQCVVDV